MQVFGIDIGGSGIKGAPVNVETGELTAGRVRIPTPQPATPDAIIETCAAMVRESGWQGPVGCGFPAVIKDGTVMTAANIDAANIGFDIKSALESELKSQARVINDADAAGLAEMRWGAGRGESGVVLVLTLGTGIGTALFTGEHLVPNTELGHIELRGRDAETYASDAARKREDLSWKKYAKRLNEYIEAIERLLWPDLIIIGGGISKRSGRFLPHLETHAKIVPAGMLNEAGIAGAALAASKQFEAV